MERASGTIEYIQKGDKRTNTLMNPRLAACNAKERTITIEFPVQEWQLNQYDVMHGGLIATAFDEALGIFALYLNHGKQIVSVNISLNYVKPVPMDGAILNHGKSNVFREKDYHHIGRMPLEKQRATDKHGDRNLRDCLMVGLCQTSFVEYRNISEYDKGRKGVVELWTT